MCVRVPVLSKCLEKVPRESARDTLTHKKKNLSNCFQGSQRKEMNEGKDGDEKVCNWSMSPKDLSGEIPLYCVLIEENLWNKINNALMNERERTYIFFLKLFVAFDVESLQACDDVTIASIEFK